jgi:MFS family permease
VSYASVLKRHPRPLAFGFSCGAISNFGQTFFIALFVPAVTASFSLDRTGFSSLYGACTIASAVLMPVIGRGIDLMSLARFAALAQAGLALGLIVMAGAPTVVVLGAGLLLVRFCGQGLMKHIAATSTSRFFERSRGKALALVGLGHPVGEGLLPLATTFAIAALGWRSSLLLCAAVVAVVVVVGQLILRPLDTLPAHYRATDDELATGDGGREQVRASWSRRQLLTHPGFLLLIPFWISPAFVLTGLFFHQLAIGEALGFSPELMAGSFTVYAVGASATSMLAGPLIDRLGPRRLTPWMLVPLTTAVLLLLLARGTWVAPLYLGLVGACVGMAGVRGAWLAERFGLEHLGAIRSALMAIAVLATAIAPPVFGVLLDAELGVDGILQAVALALLAVHVLTAVGLGWLDRAAGGPKARDRAVTA